jgi:hypothetical protein
MRWTLQTLIDERMTVRAYCHNSHCHHNQSLDLEAWRDRLGPDAPAMADELTPRLKCGKCGERKIGLIYTPARRVVWSHDPGVNSNTIRQPLRNRTIRPS